MKFSFRITKSEQEHLVKLAETCNCTPAKLVRSRLFKGRYPEAKDAKLDVTIFLELRKIGVNINQLAKHANSGRLPFGVAKTLGKLMEQQEQIITLLIHDSQSENR